MRYYEIVGLDESVLTEQMLQEGFLDSIRQTIGNQITKKVTVVNNTATALHVIYNVISKPDYLDSMTFEVKRSIKRKIKNMTDGKLKQAVSRMFPDGRTLKDFLIGICLVAVMNSVAQATKIATDAAKEAALDRFKEEIAERVLGLGATVLSGGAGGFMNVFKALEVGNDILFELLDALNRKLNSLVVQTA